MRLKKNIKWKNGIIILKRHKERIAHFFNQLKHKDKKMISKAFSKIALWMIVEIIPNILFSPRELNLWCRKEILWTLILVLFKIKIEAKWQRLHYLILVLITFKIVNLVIKNTANNLKLPKASTKINK